MKTLALHTLFVCAGLHYAIWKNEAALRAEFERKRAAVTTTIVTSMNARIEITKSDQFDLDMLEGCKVWIPDPSKHFGVADEKGYVRLYICFAS